MSAINRRLAIVVVGLLSLLLVVLTLRTGSLLTIALVLSGVVTFWAALVSAVHLLGHRAAYSFAAIAMAFGWFAEQMGATHGWFFGDYDYTEVLGPRIVEVPAVIPLMWFALVYIGYVIVNLIVWQQPVAKWSRWRDAVWMALLTGFVVTAYDLAADPYMVYVLEAWIMEKTDGYYFGETVVGFVGWVFVSFVIVMAFHALNRHLSAAPVTRAGKCYTLLPVLSYLGFLSFFVFKGYPVETRSIVVFAMGIPVLAAVAGFVRWVRRADSGRAE